MNRRAFVYPQFVGRPAAILILILLGAPSASAALTGTQLADAPAPSIDERLARIREGLYSGASDARQAIEDLKAILAVAPQSAEAHLLLGVAQHTIGSPDLMGESVAEFRQAVALNPSLIEARFFLARVYLELGRQERAREELTTALEQVPGHPQFLALLGETERQLGNPQRAFELTTEALKADSSADQARYYLALALLDMHKTQEATAELERIARSGAQVADVFVSLGKAYAEANRLEKAALSLEEAVRINPALPDAHILLARVYRRRGLLQKADAQLDLATPQSTATVDYQQTQARLYLERGLLRLRQKRLDEAVRAFTSAVETDPANGLAHRHLAEAYLQKGATSLAAEHAAAAAKLGSPLAPDKQKILSGQQRRKGAGPGR